MNVLGDLQKIYSTDSVSVLVALSFKELAQAFIMECHVMYQVIHTCWLTTKQKETMLVPEFTKLENNGPHQDNIVVTYIRYCARIAAQ